jgi:thiamine-phosphate diphosphorylase
VLLDRKILPPVYALTDAVAKMPLDQLVPALITAGIRWIQIREKNMPDDELYRSVRTAEECMTARAMLFVDDRADIALACDADGVHVGEHDLPPASVRDIAAGRPLFIGYSTHSVEEAIAAASDDAIDYVAIGPIFRSRTKNVRDPLGVGAIEQIRGRTGKPIVAIGGIDASNISFALRAGADSCAVIAALYETEHSIVDNVHRLLDAAEAR